MHHEVHVIAIPMGTLPHPSAECQVHRTVSITMRHPLHQKPPRSGEMIQEAAEPSQVCRGNGTHLAMDDGTAGSGILRAGARRAPHVNFMTFSRQCSGQQFRIIAHSAHLRRILVGDHVPG